MSLATVATGQSSVSALTSYTLDAANWATPLASPQGPLSLAVRLTTSVSGSVSKVRFYKDVSFLGPHTAYVWDANGVVLSQQLFTNETASGWQEVTLSSPAAIGAGDTFSVGYTLENGFSYIPSGFSTSVVGPLTIVGGFYVYAAGTFPSNAYTSNYMVDLTFDTGGSPTTSTTAMATSTTTTSVAATSTTNSTSTTTSSTTTSSTTTTTPVIVATTAPATTNSTTTTSTSTTAVAATGPTTPPPTTTPPATAPPTDPIASRLSRTTDPQQVASLLTEVLDAPITPEVAATVASNPAALAVATPAQAAKLFKAIHLSALDAGAIAALVAAVSAAPPALKATFERTIDVYGAGLDRYVPNGSSINVGARRSIVAATTVVASAAAATSRTGSSSSGSGSERSRTNGDKGSEGDDEVTRRNRSVARRRARSLGARTRRFSSHELEDSMKPTSPLMRFIRRLAREISNMAFTLAGSVIVLATLSGKTRTIALVATVIALVLHFGLALTRNETD